MSSSSRRYKDAVAPMSMLRRTTTSAFRTRTSTIRVCDGVAYVSSPITFTGKDSPLTVVVSWFAPAHPIGQSSSISCSSMRLRSAWLGTTSDRSASRVSGLRGAG